MTKTAEVGKAVPDFTAVTSTGKQFSLAKPQDHHVVLYFYPKDNTPGCTQEGLDFTALATEFAKLNTVVLGVSRDSAKSHENFRKKHHLTIELIPDENEQLCTLFDVIREKNMYGKKMRGIERSTFLIDAYGVLRQEWRKVKVADHAREVLETVAAL
jgi:peroxiredoxin Q/BCP